MVDYIRLAIGAIFNLIVWTMLALNVFVLACIMKGRLHVKKNNSVYALAAFNIGCDVCQLLLHVCYIGPAVISGKWFFEGQDSLGVTIIGTCFLGLWFLGSLVQILFATNRLAVICFPRSTFFSMSRVIKSIALCCCIAIVMVVYAQLVSPCCRITPDPRYFGYSYLLVPNQSNLSYYVDLLIDVIVSVYGGISYIAVSVLSIEQVGLTATFSLFPLYAYVLKMEARSDRERKREMRCLVQFLLMFLTYTFVWITFFSYPAIGIKAPEAYVITPIMLVFNCGINAVIYLIMNNEVRKAARLLMGKDNSVKPLSSFAQSILSNHTNQPTSVTGPASSSH
ncbi:hypothetical protein Aduo_000421 [Ancylostoma duodenale]